MVRTEYQIWRDELERNKRRQLGAVDMAAIVFALALFAAGAVTTVLLQHGVR